MIWRRLPNGIGRSSTRRWAWISSVGRRTQPSCTSTAPRKPYDYNKAHLETFGDVFQAWMIRRIMGGAKGLQQLVCEGKTLRGSAMETEDGSHRYGLRPTA